MQELRFIAIIPARYASSRFPGKPLATIGEKTVIQHVYEQVSKVINDVYVATDDHRIYTEVNKFGGKAIMTSEFHKSGTDRCFEAYTKINQSFDVIINVQGDEPFIQPQQINEIMQCYSDNATTIATLVKKILPGETESVLLNPNTPKVVLDSLGYAIYFSRSPIPFLRNIPVENWLNNHEFYKHIGIYAYRPETLNDITKLNQSVLEKAESLEQLRWLQNGFKIKTGITNLETIGIDTPEDLAKARLYFTEEA